MTDSKSPPATEPSAPRRDSSTVAALQVQITELTGRLPGLQAETERINEELQKSQVIRRHVVRNPEKFSPHERENVFEHAEGLAVRRQQLRDQAEAVRERLDLLEQVKAYLIPPADPSLPSTLDVYQAVESERLRIARDLHDGPAQVLSNLVLEAEILERLQRRDPALLTSELQQFKNSVRNAVDDMRRFMFDLRPVSLDELGLVSTMRRITSEYQDRTGVVCRFNVIGDQTEMAAVVQDSIYWIIQEALTNVHRHARARTVEINLDIEESAIRLRIRDDGQGFDPRNYHQSSARRKLGVLNMKERAEAVGGQLEVRSHPGSGTSVEAIFSPRLPT
ncbi:MAG TPA: sensor histidine kinase [Candidatus Acidoferrales bacterium]|nr:sensor histidine kinase [Candidatus Acidoferrales bacterium]